MDKLKSREKDWLYDPVISWFMDYIMGWVGFSAIISLVMFVSSGDLDVAFDTFIVCMKFGALIPVLGYGPLAFLVFLGTVSATLHSKLTKGKWD
jgi:hypothetical protein